MLQVARATPVAALLLSFPLAFPLVLVAGLVAGFPGEAHAKAGFWLTDSGVGPNQISYTVDIQCGDVGIVCEALDDYVDVQVANVLGFGPIDLDLAAGTWQQTADASVDLDDGMGPRTSYGTLAADNLTFAEIPLVGAPQTDSGMVFHLSGPAFDGGDDLVPGDYPISALVSIAATADIVGPVDPHLPEITIGPTDVTLTGSLRILSVNQVGGVTYEVRDLTGSLNVANPTVLAGENVVVDVTADMTLNFAGSAGRILVPALDPWSQALLVGLLGLLGLIMGRTVLFVNRSDAR